MTIHKNTEIKSAILDRVTLVGKQGSAVKDLVPRIVCGAPPGNQSWEKAFQALEESAGASTWTEILTDIWRQFLSWLSGAIDSQNRRDQGLIVFFSHMLSVIFKCTLTSTMSIRARKHHAQNSNLWPWQDCFALKVWHIFQLWGGVWCHGLAGVSTSYALLCTLHPFSTSSSSLASVSSPS